MAENKTSPTTKKMTYTINNKILIKKPYKTQSINAVNKSYG
jgi:hypothetical protein